MRKTAAIFHGLGGSENSFWIPWLKTTLETEGLDVWTPSMPPCNGFDDLDAWVQEAAATAPHRDYDVMVGHSAGGTLILQLLSRNDFSARRAITVASFVKPLTDHRTNDLDFPAGFDVEIIRRNCRALTYIHSDNDPWACGQEQGEFMRRSLGGTLIVMTGQGHFGSDAMQQPYKKFPLLLAHCLLEV
jgi:predicted alpha/beta hydrolase family esterase